MDMDLRSNFPSLLQQLDLYADFKKYAKTISGSDGKYYAQNDYGSVGISTLIRGSNGKVVGESVFEPSEGMNMDEAQKVAKRYMAELG